MALVGAKEKDNDRMMRRFTWYA